MVKLNIEVKFPCGYELKYSVSGFMCEFEGIPDIESCPIHGKECVSKLDKGKGK